jgi:nitric oxide synthase oxygenase domain/subunit
MGLVGAARVKQLQLIDDQNKFISQAILAALQHHPKIAFKTLSFNPKPQGHVFHTLNLLNSAEFNNIPFGDPAEIEKTIQMNRHDWDETDG